MEPRDHKIINDMKADIAALQEQFAELKALIERDFRPPIKIPPMPRVLRERYGLKKKKARDKHAGSTG